MEDWGFREVGGSLWITRIRVSVGEVLKGAWNGAEIVFALEGQTSMFHVGDELVICAKRRNLPSGGTYVTSPYVGIYGSDGGMWKRWVADDDMEREEILTNSELRERIQRGSITNLTSSADVVARGIVSPAGEFTYRTDDGRMGQMRTFRLEVTEWLKGHETDDFLEFVVPSVNADYVPQWYRDVPRGIVDGGEWLVFLRRGDQGLFPFGGPNSLLSIRGESVVYDDAVEMSLGARDLGARIRQEVEREQK